MSKIINFHDKKYEGAFDVIMTIVSELKIMIFGVDKETNQLLVSKYVGNINKFRENIINEKGNYSVNKLLLHCNNNPDEWEDIELGVYVTDEIKEILLEDGKK